MNRCRETDALLDATFAGAELTREQADHATACTECAHALAQARRFDGELHRIGRQLAPEPLPSVGEITHLSTSTGRRSMARRRTLAVGAAGALLLAATIFGGGAWIGSLLTDEVQVGGISPEALDAWVDQTLPIALQMAERPRTGDGGLEPAQIETCGQTAVVFYGQRNDAGGYVWAIGRPDRTGLIETGWSLFLDEPDVAQFRALLPVCEVVLGPAEPPEELVDWPPIERQGVVAIADFWWVGEWGDELGEGEVVVEDNGRNIVIEGDSRAVAMGLHRRAFLAVRVDDRSVQAVDIVTAEGRLRYTVAAPGFIIEDVGAEALRFELLDHAGIVVAAGPIVQWESDDRRGAVEAQARRAAVAEAERRALEAELVATRCREWATMSEEEQVAVIEVLVPDLEGVRVLQQLSADAPQAEIIAAARSSLDEGCQASADDRAVADVAQTLYGD
jgi:hypothetical protein